MAEKPLSDYAELVKDLPSEELLHQGRAILVRGWQEQPNDSLTRDSLSVIRDLMKRVVQLEKPNYDSKELEHVVEPEGKTLF